MLNKLKSKHYLRENLFEYIRYFDFHEKIEIITEPTTIYLFIQCRRVTRDNYYTTAEPNDVLP